jgi:hypothetical protein
MFAMLGGGQYVGLARIRLEHLVFERSEMQRFGLTPYILMVSAAIVWMGIGSATVGAQGVKSGEKTPTTAQGAERSPWVALLDSALTVKAGEGGKNLSIANGAIAGITVDRTNGDVYAFLRSDKGVVKSEDQGANFKDHSTLAVDWDGQACRNSWLVKPGPGLVTMSERRGGRPGSARP